MNEHTMDLSTVIRIFSCRLCSQHVEPPIYECDGKNGTSSHLACVGCFKKLSGGLFPRCEEGSIFRFSNFAVKAMSTMTVRCSSCGIRLAYLEACHRCVAESPWMCQKCELEPAKDATTLDAIMHNIAATTNIKCSHDGYGSLVSHHEVHNHEIACPHGPCTCTEPGCNFDAPPAALVIHLAAAHSIQVHRFPYGKPKELLVSVPMPDLACSPCRRLVVEGEDGVMFILTIGALGPATVVSSVCVRSAACMWPLYTVRMWACGPPTSSLAYCKSNIMEVEAEASSSTSPGAVAFEELTSFLWVPPRYLVGAAPSRQLRFFIRVDKGEQ